jgi:2-oxoglutarate/2-oxoacid ferredoxin oxidoreductase subunit beta
MSEGTIQQPARIPVRVVEGRTFLDTSAAPTLPGRVVDDFTPALIDVGEHHLCPGCGEPIAMRSVLEAIHELTMTDRAIAVFGIGCYTAFANNLDVEVLQALHGRAPSLATGVKRCKPDTIVVTIQGDGDMVNEGLQEVVHAAARGEAITCFMLDNGVFGETGGHLTATTVVGQRTKNTLDGRDAALHGRPIRMASLLAQVDGASYVARGAVHTAGDVSRTKRMITRALEVQRAGGFSFVEILTMCPTGWFIETQQAPDYLATTLEPVHSTGVLKDVDAGIDPTAG